METDLELAHVLEDIVAVLGDHRNVLVVDLLLKLALDLGDQLLAILGLFRIAQLHEPVVRVDSHGLHVPRRIDDADLVLVADCAVRVRVPVRLGTESLSRFRTVVGVFLVRELDVVRALVTRGGCSGDAFDAETDGRRDDSVLAPRGRRRVPRRGGRTGPLALLDTRSRRRRRRRATRSSARLDRCGLLLLLLLLSGRSSVDAETTEGSVS